MSIASTQSFFVGHTVEQPPQRRDPGGADGELNIGELRGPGELSGEVGNAASVRLSSCAA